LLSLLRGYRLLLFSCLITSDLATSPEGLMKRLLAVVFFIEVFCSVRLFFRTSKSLFST